MNEKPAYTIIPYEPKYKQTFIDMNLLWIREMFVVEPEDEYVLNHIEEELEKGAQIYLAVQEEEVLACCMVAPIGDGEWELEKLAARGMYTGSGAGTACLKACMDYAKAQGAEKLTMVSNTKCTHGVSIYRKLGFTEIPVDKEKFPFERGNIAFEMVVLE